MTSKIDEKKVEKFLGFHIQVLKALLKGKDFHSIEKENASRFEEMNYREVASNGFSFLSFDGNNRLGAAYPISAGKTDYRINVEDVGSGYAMCAIDALGAAYFFGAKTRTASEDPATKVPLNITIDPDNLDISAYSDIAVTVPAAMPKKPESETLDPSVDFCPLIGFFENRESIPEEQLSHIGVIPFEQAFEQGRRQFDSSRILQDLKASLITLLKIHESDSLPEDDIVQTFLKYSSDILVKAIPPDYLYAIVMKQLLGKKTIQKSKAHPKHFELTTLGRKTLDTFLIRLRQD